MTHLRVIFDQPCPGTWNMAVDEALLQTASESAQATLRFYTWAEPTLSLGYFQSVLDREQHPASSACPIVRRASGGGAILHDRELTYSIVLPRVPSAAAKDLYQIAHLTLIETLALLSIECALYRDDSVCKPAATEKAHEPFLCFQRRTCFDVVCRHEKVVGSAQRRRKNTVLQHGSVLLARSPRAPELPGVQELAGVTIVPNSLAMLWLPRLAGALQLTTHEGGLTNDELALAQRLVTDRFATAAFADRR